MDAGQVSIDNRLDEFVRLLSEHDRGVLLFILSLVPNWDDAEEIRQETNVKLWQEFNKFQSGTDFGKWARTIARYEVLTFKTRGRRDWLRVSQRSMDLVTAEVEVAIDNTRTRQTALTECVKELSAFNRELVRLYYTVGRKIREIARDLRCTPDAAYKALQRTRIELRQCVDRRLGEGELP
jgi:RNA polymerase sigma-70 factor, ECF subfamily